MNYRSNKKAQVVQTVFMWIFATFFYFTIGFTILKAVLVDIFIPQGHTGAMYFLVIIVPYIPVLGLMWWGYRIMNPEGVEG